MPLPLRFAVASLFVLVCMCAASCESRVSLGATCTSSSSCADGLRCEFGRCRGQCVSASDCASGALCIGDPGVCTLTTDTCEAECAPGLICSGTICAIPCSEAIGCRGGSICDDDSSVCVAASSADAGPPVDAPSVDAGVGPTDRQHAMCVGYAHACAIRGGLVYCWGNAHSGQIGDSESSSAVEHDGLCGPWNCLDHPQDPVRRSTGAGTVVLDEVLSIACGNDTTCAVRSGGSVWCWGGSGEELGHSGTGAHADFVITERATSVDLGRHHGCARVGDAYQCWGANVQSFSVDGGVLNDEDARLGSLGPSTRTPRAAPLFDGASRLTLGALFTCRVDAEGVRCIGFNEGATGSGVPGADPVGSLVPGLPAVLDDVSAGVAHVCAASGGDVLCWGANLYGVLASEDLPDCFAPAVSSFCRPNAVPVDRGFDVEREELVSLSRGPGSTVCAITRAGRALCWGWNSYGQAGIENPPLWRDVEVLTDFVSTSPGTPLEGITSIGCGAASCCADTSTGVYCWGENDLGQLGNGTSDSRELDAAVPDGGPTLALPHPYATAVDFSRITL